MVASIETTMEHPKRGLIKPEDTVAVTATGHEIFGEGARGGIWMEHELAADRAKSTLHPHLKGLRVSTTTEKWPRCYRVS